MDLPGRKDMRCHHSGRAGQVRPLAIFTINSRGMFTRGGRNRAAHCPVGNMPPLSHECRRTCPGGSGPAYCTHVPHNGRSRSSLHFSTAVLPRAANSISAGERLSPQRQFKFPPIPRTSRRDALFIGRPSESTRSFPADI